MKRLIFIVFSLLVVTGCTNDPQVIEKTALQQKHEKIHIPPNKSLLYIVRPARIAASGQHYKININGKHIAVMETGTYFPYLIPSGTVDISAESKPSILNFGLALAFMAKPKLTLTALQGKTYFINVGVAFSGGPTLTHISQEDGEPLVHKARKIKTD